MNSHASTTNRLLTATFAILLVIQVSYLLVGFASIPAYYQRVTTQSMEPVIYYGQVQLSNAMVGQMATDRGLSLEQYASYRIAAGLIAAPIPLALAIVIVWRSGWKWFAWFTAFVIVYLCERALQEQMLAARLIPLEVFGAYAIFWFLLLSYFFLFSNGRAAPRRLGGRRAGGLPCRHSGRHGGCLHRSRSCAAPQSAELGAEPIHLSRAFQFLGHLHLPDLSLSSCFDPERTPVDQVVPLRLWASGSADSRLAFSG